MTFIKLAQFFRSLLMGRPRIPGRNHTARIKGIAFDSFFPGPGNCIEQMKIPEN